MAGPTRSGGRFLCSPTALVLLAAGFPSATDGAEVRDLRLWRAPDHTRLVLDMDGPAEHRLIELSDPRRVVIDVQNTKLLASTKGLELANTPIVQVRTGVRNGTDLRLVLDLRKQIRPRSFTLNATENSADRLVVDLYDLAESTSEPRVTKRAERTERRPIVIAIDA
ncbi:MAG: AMIN domain-containing protein, partial [Pseudomonadota bacterium]